MHFVSFATKIIYRGSFVVQWQFSGIIFEKFWSLPKFFFDVHWYGGVKVHPKKPKKIVGKYWEKLSPGVKLRFFCPWDQF